MSQLIVKDNTMYDGYSFSVIREHDQKTIANMGMMLLPDSEGVVWAEFTDEIQHHKKELFARMKTGLSQIIGELKLKKITALVHVELVDKAKFIDRLGFKKTDDFIYFNNCKNYKYILEVNHG